MHLFWNASLRAAYKERYNLAKGYADVVPKLDLDDYHSNCGDVEDDTALFEKKVQSFISQSGDVTSKRDRVNSRIKEVEQEFSSKKHITHLSCQNMRHGIIFKSIIVDEDDCYYRFIAVRGYEIPVKQTDPVKHVIRVHLESEPNLVFRVGINSETTSETLYSILDYYFSYYKLISPLSIYSIVHKKKKIQKDETPLTSKLSVVMREMPIDIVIDQTDSLKSRSLDELCVDRYTLVDLPSKMPPVVKLNCQNLPDEGVLKMINTVLSRDRDQCIKRLEITSTI